MLQNGSSMSEPGGAVGLSTRIAAVVPSSSSRRGGAGSLYCRALRRRRGEEPVQNHRIDGVPRVRSVCSEYDCAQPFFVCSHCVPQRCRQRPSCLMWHRCNYIERPGGSDSSRAASSKVSRKNSKLACRDTLGISIRMTQGSCDYHTHRQATKRVSRISCAVSPPGLGRRPLVLAP